VDHFGRALYFQSDGDIDHALAQYRALFEQNHANAEVHNNLGLRIRVAISWTT
jgi:Tfp pilus assembly protein PilF